MIKPEGHKVLVEADKVDDRTGGGLYIPKTSQQSEQIKVTKGTVLAIGPTAVANFDTEDGAGEALKVGDRVIFAKYGGLYLGDDKARDLRIINDADIVAKI